MFSNTYLYVSSSPYLIIPTNTKFFFLVRTNSVFWYCMCMWTYSISTRGKTAALFSTKLGGFVPCELLSPTPDNASCARNVPIFYCKVYAPMLSNLHSFSVNIKRNFIRFVCMRDQKKKISASFSLWKKNTPPISI